MARSISIRRFGLRQSALVLALVFAPLRLATSAESGVVAALEEAAIVVVGEVVSVTGLAHAGYLAELEIERSFRRDASIGSSDSAKGTSRIVVAWEEPAPSLPPRFSEGRRVLVALVSLPTASIWRLRISDDEERAGLVGLAGGGEGYLLRPAAGELDVIEHYLALDEPARRGDAGIFLLSRLCVVGQPRLATDAAQRLKDEEALADHVTPAAARAIVDALLLPERKEITRRLLDAIQVHRPTLLRPVLEARIRQHEPDVPVILFSARAALDGELDGATIERLLVSADPAAREEAAARAVGRGARDWLRDLARSDSAPRVRAAALRRLARLDGLAATSDLISGLDDPEPSVRLSAAEATAGLGAEAVDPLRERALRGQSAGAQAAVAALSLMGSEAIVALMEIAAEHPDAGMRTIAEVALGRPVGDQH